MQKRIILQFPHLSGLVQNAAVLSGIARAAAADTAAIIVTAAITTIFIAICPEKMQFCSSQNNMREANQS